MRIISGTARGCKLAEFSTKSIRPTSDRVREAIFSILVSRLGNLSDRIVLDLFAGTGAMGLEALSRGASKATFIELSKEATGLIHKNAVSAKLLDKTNIVQADVRHYLTLQKGVFDLIFMDPPYQEQDITEIVQRIATSNILKPDGLLCVETAYVTPLPDAATPLVQVDRRKYGSTSISIYGQGDGSDE